MEKKETAAATASNEQEPSSRAYLNGPVSQLIVLLGLCIFFFWRVIFASSAKIIAGYDIIVYHYYARVFTRESLLRGLLPKWNAYEYAGMPFASDPGNCVFYPLNKFFLLMPISKAISLSMVLHVFLAGAGMLLFARAIGLRRTGSLLSAVTFMLSGYFIDRIAAGHEILVMCSTYLPWIFFSYEMASQSGRVVWALLGGVLVGLQVLTGASQPVLYTAIFVFVYAVIKSSQMPAGTRLRLACRDLGFLALMGAVGVGLSAVQLIPAVELVSQSVRTQTSAAFVGSYSFPPRNFIHFLLPYVNVGRAVGNWEYTCYVGILPLTLALTAVISFKGREVRALVAVGAISVLIMLGNYIPTFPILLKIVPGLSLFRIHARAELGLVMAIAALAGVMWERIFNHPPEESRALRNVLAVIAGVLAAAVSFTVILFLAGKLRMSFEVPAPSRIFGLLANHGGPITSLWHPRIFLPMSAVFIAFIATVLLLRRCDTGMKYLVGGLVAIDLCVMNSSQVNLTDLGYLTRSDRLIESIKRDGHQEYFRVWFPLNVFFGSRAKFFGIFDVNGHNALGLNILEKYLESLSGVSPVRTAPYYEMDSRLFERHDVFVNNVLNVKYYCVEQGDGPTFYRADSFFPRALFVSDYVVAPPQDFVPSGINPETMVMLHEEPPRGLNINADANLGDARVVIDSYSNDEILLSVDAPSDGFVVLSEVYYPGWRAEVDKIPTKVLRGDFLLRVIPVTQGQHRLKVFFAPLSLTIGKFASGATAVIVLGAFLYLYRRRESRQQTQRN